MGFPQLLAIPTISTFICHVSFQVLLAWRFVSLERQAPRPHAFRGQRTTHAAEVFTATREIAEPSNSRPLTSRKSTLNSCEFTSLCLLKPHNARCILHLFWRHADSVVDDTICHARVHNKFRSCAKVTWWMLYYCFKGNSFVASLRISNERTLVFLHETCVQRDKTDQSSS